MTKKPGVSHEELGRIPLLRGFGDAQLDKFLALCEPATVDGDVLFEAGAATDAFYLLTSGSVSLMRDGQQTHKLHPVVIIGELAALTGRTRNTTAVVGDGYEVWQIRVSALKQLFDDDKELGLAFHRNLLDVVTDKIHRDQIRLHDMRTNIIATQKDMKRMREFLLESDDTEVSSPVHEVLDENIRRNRRVNYRVEPPAALASSMRLGENEAKVVQISRTNVTVKGHGGNDGDRISGVLCLSGPEIPVSGKITSTADEQTEIELDLLLDEYAAQLEGYLTRIQMLDLLV